MNTNDLIKVIVGVVVGAVLLTALLVPITSDNSLKDQKTGTNTGTDYFKEVDGTTISVDLSNGVAVTIDGVAVTIEEYGVIAITDTFMLTRATDAINMADPSANQWILAGSSEGSMTLTMSAGAYTATAGNKTITGTYDKALVKCTSQEDADYLHQTTGTVSSGDQSVMYVGAVLWGASQGASAIADLASGSQAYSLKAYTDFNVTSSSDQTVTWEVHDNGNGSYDVSQFTDSASTTPINTFIPIEYTYYEDNSISTMVGMIPLLVTIGLIMGAVGLIATRND